MNSIPGAGILASVARFYRCVRDSWDSSDDESGSKLYDDDAYDTARRYEVQNHVDEEARKQQNQQDCERREEACQNKNVDNGSRFCGSIDLDAAFNTTTDADVKQGSSRKKFLGMDTMRQSILVAPDRIGRNDFVVALTHFTQGEITLHQLLDAMFLLKQQLSLRISMRLFQALNTPSNLKTLVSCLVDTSVVENSPEDRLRTYRYPFIARHVLADGSQAIRMALLKSCSDDESSGDRNGKTSEGVLVDDLLDYLERDSICELVCTHIIAVLISLLRESRPKVVSLMSGRTSFLPALVNKVRYDCVSGLITAIIADDFEAVVEIVEATKSGNMRSLRSMAPLANSRMRSSMSDTGYGMLYQPGVKFLVEGGILDLLSKKFCDAVGETVTSALPTKNSNEEVPEVIGQVCKSLPPSPSASSNDKSPPWYQNMQQAQNALSTIMSLARGVAPLAAALPKVLKTILSTVIQAYLQLNSLLAKTSPKINPLNPYLLLSLTLTLRLLSPPTSVPTHSVFPYLQFLITILIDLTPAASTSSTPSSSPVLRLSILNTLFEIQYWSLSILVNRDFSLRKQSGKALETARLSEVMWQVGKRCGESEEVQRVVRKAASDGFGGNLGDEGWRLWMGPKGKVGKRVVTEWEKSTGGGRSVAREWKRTVVEVGGWIVSEGGSRVERDLGSDCGARLRKLVAKEQEIRGQNFWKSGVVGDSRDGRGSLRKTLKIKTPLIARGGADLDTGRGRSSVGRRKSISESKLKSLFDEPAPKSLPSGNK